MAKCSHSISIFVPQCPANARQTAVDPNRAVGLAVLIALVGAPAEAKSTKAVAEFKRENPCLSNDNRSGSCHGYEVDHLRNLKCDGSDMPSNMQGLTISAHKKKTKREAKSCRIGSSELE